MIDNYTKIDLPKLPDSFILSLEDIRNQSNICPTTSVVPDGKSIFAVYDTSTDIKDFYHDYIDFPHVIRWQVITADLPLHYDWGHTMRKYLYLIDQGGASVKTQFFSQKENDPVDGGSFDVDDRELLFEISEDTKCWHMLNVKKPHRVVNITRPRIALIIRED